MTRPILPFAVLAWNCKVGRRKSFDTELDRLPPHSIYAFNEAVGRGREAQLADWARERKLRRIESSGGVMLYVGPRVVDVGSGVEHVNARWLGPKGKRFNTRPIIWAMLRVDNRPLYVVVQHAPWNPVKNGVAWRAYQKRLRRMGTWFPSVDMLLIGDANQSWAKRVAWAIRGTANKIRGRYVPTGAAVDYAVFRPGDPGEFLVKGALGARLGSDHKYTSYRLISKER